MKFISFRHGEHHSYGEVRGEEVADLGGLDGAQRDLKAAIAAGLLGKLAGQEQASLRLEAVELLPVIPNPGKILCVGHDYESHRQGTGRAKVGSPSIFIRFADTLTAHGAEIVRPKVSETLITKASWR